MKRLCVLSMIAALAVAPSLQASAGGQAERKVEGAAREKESKKRVSKKQKSEKFEATLTVMNTDRAQFYVDDTKVGPFDFKGLRTSDTGKILLKKDLFNGIMVVGILNKAKEGNEQLFALKFDPKWQNPKVLLQYPLVGGAAGTLKEGSEVIKLTDDAILVAAVKQDAQSLTLFRVNFAGKELNEPQTVELDTMPLKGPQVDAIDKITKISVTGNKARVTYSTLPDKNSETAEFDIRPQAVARTMPEQSSVAIYEMSTEGTPKLVE